MKTATVRELRNEFGKLSKWIEKGETICILKRGKPFASISPQGGRKPLLGATPSPFPVPDDLDEPVGITWEALE